MIEELLKIANKYEKLINAGGVISTLFLVYITIRYNRKIIKETKKNINQMEKSNRIAEEAFQNSKQETKYEKIVKEMEREEERRVRDLEVVSDLIEKKIIDEFFFFLLEKRNFEKYIENKKEKFKKVYVENKLKDKRFENVGDCIIDNKMEIIYYSSDNKAFNEAFNFVYKMIEDLKFLKGILTNKVHQGLIIKITDEGKTLHNYSNYKKIHNKTIMAKLGVCEKLKSSDIDEETRNLLRKYWGYNGGFEKQLEENCYYFERTQERVGDLKKIYYDFKYFNEILNKY